MDKKKAISITIAPHVHEAGKAQGQAMGLNLSAYISYLITKDNRENFRKVK